MSVEVQHKLVVFIHSANLVAASISQNLILRSVCVWKCHCWKESIRASQHFIINEIFYIFIITWQVRLQWFMLNDAVMLGCLNMVMQIRKVYDRLWHHFHWQYSMLQPTDSSQDITETDLPQYSNYSNEVKLILLDLPANTKVVMKICVIIKYT